MKGNCLILGNWKMHLNAASAAGLGAAVAASASGNLSANGVSIGVCPAFVHLAVVRQALSGSAILLGAQDCHDKEEGAYTGDVSAKMLKDAGCAFTLVGHSERRLQHHENDGMVRAKARAAIREGLHAVICVGETLEQRESGNSHAIIEAQLRASLPEKSDREDITVAYEPIWAIGTGRAASNDDISAMHTHIRSVLRGICDGGIPRVLYGGSVKANNALDILSLPVVDGVLVGGASLDAEAFGAIIGAASALQAA